VLDRIEAARYLELRGERDEARERVVAELVARRVVGARREAAQRRARLAQRALVLDRLEAARCLELRGERDEPLERVVAELGLHRRRRGRRVHEDELEVGGRGRDRAERLKARAGDGARCGLVGVECAIEHEFTARVRRADDDAATVDDDKVADVVGRRDNFLVVHDDKVRAGV
jgi:hypothetical protein